MPKRRDAQTGQYIDAKTAEGKDPSTWVTETDTRQELLRNLYEQLLAHAGYCESEDFESIKVEWVTKIFQDNGLKI